MNSFRRLLIVLTAWSGLGISVRAGQLVLPPISGEFAGTFVAEALAGFPPVAWRLRVGPGEGGQRQIELLATMAGGRLRVDASVATLGGDGAWKIVEGDLDAAAWFPVLAPELGGAASGMTAVGRVEVSGSGELKNGRPSGVIQVTWNGGALRDAAQGWSLEDITLRGDYVVDGESLSLKSKGPLELTVRTITTSRFGARNIFIRGLLNEGATFSLLEGKIEIAGGLVTIDPCTFPLTPPVLEFNLRIDRIGLQDVVALVPAGLSDARGRVDGEVRIRWSQAAGIQVGSGQLALRSDEPAMVRLAAAPGFLTERLPERITLLPSWMGRLSRWLAPVNPAYADMRDIELGRATLRVRSLSVRLTPEGDGKGHTAQVQVTARPEQPGGSVEEVTFQVNVAGPLAAVLRLGLNQSMSVQLH